MIPNVLNEGKEWRRNKTILSPLPLLAETLSCACLRGAEALGENRPLVLTRRRGGRNERSPHSPCVNLQPSNFPHDFLFLPLFRRGRWNCVSYFLCPLVVREVHLRRDGRVWGRDSDDVDDIIEDDRGENATTRLWALLLVYFLV